MPPLTAARRGVASRVGCRATRWLLAPLVAGLLAAFGADLAMACSCVPRSASESLRDADAAFVGVATARRVTPTGPAGTFSSSDPAEVDFRVERAYKGTLGDEVTVHTVAGGATCGLEVQVGQRVGLFLHRQSDGGWTSSLCSMIDPDELARTTEAPPGRPEPPASQALPRPSGSGPVRFLLGGFFGGPTIIALDGRGRTLAYGAGRGAISGLAACPGGRRSVETVAVDGRRLLYLRALRSMRVLRQVTLAGEPLAVSCRSRNGHDIVALVATGDGPGSELVRLSDRGVRVLHRGSADQGSIAGRYAWLASGADARSVTRVDLRTARARRIAGLSGAYGLVASPDGRRAAFQSDAGQLCVAAGGGVLALGPIQFGVLSWVDRTSLVARSLGVVAEPVRVLDSRLRRVRGLPGFDRAVAAAGAGGRLYAISGGRLLSVRARRGAVLRLARVPTGGSSLALVGGATRVSAAARAARP